MKTIKLLLLGVFASFISAHAVPAKRGFFTYTQPDGSVIRASLAGDEFGHYYLSDDNVPMLRDSNGYFRYAIISPDGQISLSTLKARNKEQRSEEARELTAALNQEAFRAAFTRQINLTKGRRTKAKAAPQQGLGLFTSNYPRTGTVRSLVMLVEYSDVKFKIDDPSDYFMRLFNENGFSDYSGTGSVRDYFTDQSNGKFDIHYDVFGPVTLAGKRSYYGSNNSFGDDSNPEGMVREAAELLKNEIDFSQYDYDNDGRIDNIFIVYAGEGEADGGPAESVWPHAFEITNGKTYNGKKLYGYCCVNEWQHYTGRPAPIGTFVHEFSHVMGLPDLYNTNNSNASYTPGAWSVLDYGPYNNDGCTPPAYSAFERNAMGWLDPKVLTGAATIALEEIQKSNTCCLIPTEKTSEFFLLENRQQTGWDKYIPGHGMLIWHVDFVQRIWDTNAVNNTAGHQYVDILEAGGIANNISDETMALYAFPGPANNTSVTSETTPALVSWSGESINLPITGIAENDGIITFDVDGGNIELEAPAAPALSASADGSLHIEWEAVDFATGYLLDIYTKDNGTVKPHAIYTGFTTGNTTSFTAAGMKGETEYFVTLRATRGSNLSPSSPESSIVTPAIDFVYLKPITLDGTAPECDDISLSWEAVEGATDYILSVEKETSAGTSSQTVDFGSGRSTLTLPDGWTWSGTLSDCYGSNSTRYYGETYPSLKFRTDGATLTSPVFDTAVKKVSFWTRGASANHNNTVDLEGRADPTAEWQTIGSYTPADYNSTATTLSYPTDAGLRQIRIRYNRTSTGNVALDDLTITLTDKAFEPLDNLQGLRTGNVTSYMINVPDGIEKIRFFVTAIDARERRSLTSEPGTIVIGNNSAVSEIEMPDKDDADTEYYNLQGIRIANPTSGIYIRRTGCRTEKVIIR